MLVFVAACSGGGGPRAADVPVQPANGPAADYPVVVGDPFTIDGVTYTPRDTMNFDAVGFAASAAEGGDAVSGAHRTLPLPSYAEVTSLDSGKTILVRIERRGPMAGKAQIELSPGAAAQLGYTGQPQFPVRVRRVNPTEPERALLRSGQPAPARMDTPKSLLAVLMRKLEAQEGVVRPVIAPDPVLAPAPNAAPLIKPVPKAKPKPEPAPNPSPKPNPPKPAAAARPAATSAPAAHSTQGRYTYGNKANANAAVTKTGGAATQSGKFWVVTIGPFASEAQAQAALAKAKGAGYSDARIQRAN
jgi:rare lipoprotein A